MEVYMSVFRIGYVGVVVCALMTSAVASSGCTTLRPISVVSAAGAPAFSVRPGERVRVTVRDGRRVKFTVESGDAAVIVARSGARYELSDIVAMEREQFNGARTGFLVAGLLGGALLLYIAAAVGNAYGAFLGGQ
jgi:hypothetical protein